jgi:hypothetical protein
MPHAQLGGIQHLLLWAGAAGIVLIAIVAFALLRGWTFAKWMRGQIRDEIVETTDTEHFRRSVTRALGDHLKLQMEACVNRHDEADNSHGTFRRMNQAFIQAHIAQELTVHNESPVAHHVALKDYPDRGELQGAISRLEQIVANNQALILEKLSAIAAQISEMKKSRG